MEKINEQIKAVMIGHAVGDALGVPVEFASRSELKESPVRDMCGYGTYPVPAGAWSDDTSMSIAALDAIADGNINWDRIMVAFGEWYYKDKYTPTGEMFDVGNTCSYAIDNYFAHHMSVEECGLLNEQSNGNGSLMRIHPFVLMTWFDRSLRPEFEDIIEKASALTHAHERSKLACKIYSLILFNLLGLPRKDVIMYALDMAKCRYFESSEYDHFERLFDDNFDKLSTEDIKSTGYVVDTLEAAVWCVLTTDSYKECVLKAVNLGDDTDTVAAIAGGIAGALYGYDAIPKEWRDTLIKREYIEKMCARASIAWYTPESQPIKCKYPVVDLHMHVIPDVDDGARDVYESIDLLVLAEKQGVTDVFCTSHNGYSVEDSDAYQKAFDFLKKTAEEAEIKIKLHKGCEVLCAAEYIDDIIYGLDEGIFPTLGETKYVLTELYMDTKPSEAIQIIKALKEHGYIPIIAHMERNINITGPMVGMLINCGALMQVNAFSFVDEEDESFKQRARELLNSKYIHFIGSDGHRTNHRPPKIDNGIQYILDNSEHSYAMEILHENARNLLSLDPAEPSY